MDAEQLQEHENRGHALASAWLAFKVKEDDLRAAVCASLYSQFQKALPRSSFRWTLGSHEHRQRAKVLPDDWSVIHATMAGCELAIEQWETGHNVSALKE